MEAFAPDTENETFGEPARFTPAQTEFLTTRLAESTPAIYPLGALPCKACIERTPAEELYISRCITVDLPGGETAYIRRSTENDKDQIADLYRRLSRDESRTRFGHMVSEGIAVKEGMKLVSANEPESLFDIVASILHTDEETGTVTEEIVGHAGFSLYDEGDRVTGNAHIIVPKKLDADTPNRRGLGTALTTVRMLTAAACGVDLTVEIYPENTRMKGVASRTLAKLAGDKAPRPRWEEGFLVYDIPHEVLPASRFCALKGGGLGMPEADCPAWTRQPAEEEIAAA